MCMGLYVLEPDCDIKSKMVIPVKGIITVKGNSIVPDDGTVIGNKNPESVSTGPNFNTG